MMNKDEYEKKLDREKSWWKSTTIKEGAVSQALHNPLFFTRERAEFAYKFPKQQMAEIIKRHRKEKAEKLLIAPCGTGDDYQYLNQVGKEIHGIDLSPEAIRCSPPQMKLKVGDVLQSGYEDNTFDLIASPLFFHHLLKIGFSPFLKEFHRILKPGGSLLILEPSLLYPINIITRPMKRLFNNPFKEVEDEEPFRPGLMLKALKREGFEGIEVHGASYSHVTFPIPVAKFINKYTKPLLETYLLKYMAWMVIYWAEKADK